MIHLDIQSSNKLYFRMMSHTKSNLSFAYKTETGSSHSMQMIYEFKKYLIILHEFISKLIT